MTLEHNHRVTSKFTTFFHSPVLITTFKFFFITLIFVIAITITIISIAGIIIIIIIIIKSLTLLIKSYY